MMFFLDFRAAMFCVSWVEAETAACRSSGVKPVVLEDFMSLCPSSRYQSP